MKDRVHILLATYNGSEFLRDQLQSIESQTLPFARITVRDDGSTDDTVSQIESWAAGRPNVCLLRGPQLGVARNFFELLANADEGCKYFAFCDQDDVWSPHKLARAVAAIRGYEPGGPVMYCSRVEFVDEKLQHLGLSKVPKMPSFFNALVENIAMGCTVVLNAEARTVIVRNLPAQALMHDWWCYLVVSAFGKVAYDATPSVKYRLHGGNAVGAATCKTEDFRRRITRFLEYDIDAPRLVDQAEEFGRSFGALLDPSRRETLRRFLAVRGNVWCRAAYSARMDVWRQSRVDTTILRTMILIGRV